MLQQMGVNLPPGSGLQSKNIAAVMVTAQLPPFAQPGQVIDVSVASSATPRACAAAP
jgi:flagellar P-ring protein precursor FlgI